MLKSISDKQKHLIIGLTNHLSKIKVLFYAVGGYLLCVNNGALLDSSQKQQRVLHLFGRAKCVRLIRVHRTALCSLTTPCSKASREYREESSPKYDSVLSELPSKMSLCVAKPFFLRAAGCKLVNPSVTTRWRRSEASSRSCQRRWRR